MAKRYEDMTDKEKAEHDKWMARSENMKNGGKAAMGLGCSMIIGGVFLIIVVTIILMLIF